MSPEQTLPWAVWQQKLVLSIFHLKLHKSFSLLLLVLIRFNFVLPANEVWDGAGIAGGLSERGCPALGAAFGAAATAELMCSSSGLSVCLWDLVAEEGAQIPAPRLNLNRNNCTIPTCRAPPTPPALGECVLHFCHFPAASCPRLGWAYPGDASLSVHPDFSLPSVSPSKERLCFSLLGLYFIPLWPGVFCRQGTCHCCSDTSRQGLLNYPHPLKIEIHSPTALRHIFISVYSELSSS